MNISCLLSCGYHAVGTMLWVLGILCPAWFNERKYLGKSHIEFFRWLAFENQPFFIVSFIRLIIFIFFDLKFRFLTFNEFTKIDLMKNSYIFSFFWLPAYFTIYCGQLSSSVFILWSLNSCQPHSLGT